MQQTDFLGTLGVIDLISEKHKKWRGELMQRIGAQFNVKLADMDVYLLILTRHHSRSVSESARLMNISRQAAHKHAKHLESIGFVQLVEAQHSRREKLLVLTQAGEQACLEIEKMEGSLEQELLQKLGKDTYNSIKALLRQDW